MSDLILIVLIPIALVCAVALLVALAVVGYAIWCQGTAWLGRWLAARDPWQPLSEEDAAQNGRPVCEPITVLPFHRADEQS